MSNLSPLPEDPFSSSLLSHYTAARAHTSDDSAPVDKLYDEHDDFLNPSVVQSVKDKTFGVTTPNEARKYMKGSMVASEPKRKAIAWVENPNNPKVYLSKTPKHQKPGVTNIFQTPPSLAPGFFTESDRQGLTVSLELDLALKRDVLASITDRESCLNRLRQLSTSDPMVSKSYVRRLLAEVRSGSLNVVEGIVAWRRAVMTKDETERKLFTPSTPMSLPPLDGAPSSPPSHRPHIFFRWRDDNYLLKMLSDLNFLSSIPSVSSVFPPGVVPRRNPFLMSSDVDMLNLMKRDDPLVTGERDVERARNAARVVLMEEKVDMVWREREEEKKEREDMGRVVFGEMPGINSDTPILQSEFEEPPRLNVRELKVFSKSANPPLALAQVLCCAKIIVTGGEVKEMSKKVLRSVMRKPMMIVNGLDNFDVDAPVRTEVLEALYPIVNATRFSPEAIRKMSESIAGLTRWVKNFVNDKCASLGWTNGRPVYSQPVTPASGIRDFKKIEVGGKGRKEEHGDDSSDEEERVKRRRGGEQNVYVQMMETLRQEVKALKSELEGQGLRVKDAQSAVQDWEDQGGAGSSVADEPRGGSQPARRQNVHLLQESIRLEGLQTVVKVQYTDNGSTVNFTGWDPLNNTVIKGCEMGGLWVDRETGFTPVELEAMPESFRRQKLRGVIDQLTMTSTPHLNPALPDVKTLSIQVDRSVVQGIRSISSTVCEYYVSRTRDNDGLAVVVNEKQDEDETNKKEETKNQPMTMQISDAELELLLAHQPGLYLRSQRKWTSQKAICDWLITRIKIVESDTGGENDDGSSSGAGKYIMVDRNVPVPRSVENGSVDGAGDYTLKARQVGNEIILEAVPGGQGGGNDGGRPMSRVKIGLAEFQSLGALDSIPSDEGAFPSKPKTPWFSPLPGQTSKSVDLGRYPRTPLDGLLSRLSWTSKDGAAPSLGLNRVLFQDLRVVSNVSCMLRGSVMNRDVIFQAHMLKLREGIEDEMVTEDMLDAYEKVGGEMVKLVTEAEMRSMLKQRQPHELQRLLNPHNRKELCEVLAGKLKLVKIGGSFRLETELHREKALLTIAVDTTHEDDVIGAVDIDDQMTLSQLRALVEKEMDEEDLPTSFRFVSQGAPISRNQETARLAASLLPVAVILSKNADRRRERSGPPRRDDEDSEFGHVEGGGAHDDSDGSESGMSRETSKSRKKRRKTRQKKMRKAQKAKLRSAKAPDPDGGTLHEVQSDLSDSDLTGSDSDEDSLSLSLSRSSAGTKGKKKRRKTSVMVVEKRRGSIIDKRIVEKSGPGTPGKKAKEQLAKEKKEKENKPKPIPKVPIPLASLVTATQDSPTLKTQIDLTHIIFRGDAVKIWRCGKEYEEWSISSDPQVPFDATTITLSKPYKHKLKREVAEERRIPGVPTGGGRERKKDEDKVAPSLPAFAKPRARGQTMLNSMGVTKPAEKNSKQIKEERIPEAGDVIPDLQVWVMTHPNADKRPLWRKQYDNGEVPYEIDFKDSDKCEVHFGVHMPWSELEKVTTDVYGDMSDVLHQQRLDYFERVTPSKIITEAYGVLCSWHPVGKTIDNVEWAKFARDMKLFPSKTSTQVDLTFAKSVAGKKERKLDLRAFIACCTDIALIRYQALRDSPTAALTKLLMENVVMLGGVNKLAWKEAKRMAIVAEARRTCGQVRIASFHRRNVSRVVFLRKQYACVRAQTQLRRMVAKKNLKKLNNLIEDTRIFRVRHSSAVKCQKMARMYRWRKWFLKHLDDQIKEELERIRQYREKLNDKRKKKEAATVFKRVKIIQGLYALIIMSRIDNRRQSTNFGLKARVYLPATQEHFKFTIEEDMLREYLEQALEIDSLSVQEIMEPSNLNYLTDRFMIRITSERPIVLFSRRNTTERGLLVDKSSQRISGELFVMFVYRSADDFVFRAYDPKNCGQLRAAITNKQLKGWLLEDNHRRIRKEEKEYKKVLFEAQKLKNAAATGEVVDMLELQKAKEFIQAHKEKEDAKELAEKKQEEGDMMMIEMGTADKNDDEYDVVDEGGDANTDMEGTLVLADPDGNLEEGSNEKEQLSIIDQVDPPLMKPENQEACIEWLLERLRLSRNRRTKRTRLILQYEEDEDMKDEAACKLQGIWRQKQARRRIRKKARQQYEKMWDSQNYCYVYVNLRTGAMEWTKPLILGSEDLDDPKDEWRLIMNSEDGSYYYQNPATGQTAYISTDDAAKKIQRMVRNFQASDIPTPTISEVVKALRFQRVAETNYERDPNKLANIVNFALLNHCLLDDFKQARDCYNVAIKKSSTNPILSRAHAMFTLAANDNPKAKVFKKACDSLKAAALSDPDLEKFEVAQQSFFHWGVVSNPKNATALLNYALLHQCVLGDYDKAEKFYLRALAIAPTDERIIDNFELMEKNRLPGGAYAGKGPSNVVLKRSEVVEEKPEWGEWQRMFDRKSSDPTFKHFWYNKIARSTHFKEPNWKELWEIRAERSIITAETEEDGWVTYWDEQLGLEFYYNRLSMGYQAAEAPVEYDEAGEPLHVTY